MSLAEHFIEFRNRFLVCLFAIAVAMVAAFFVTDTVIDLLRRPIEDLDAVREGRIAINYTNVTTSFDLRMQIALTLGVVFASPVWLYEVWMFLMPGLRKQERRYALGFLGAALPLFLGGVTLGVVLLPHVFAVMVQFAPVEDVVFLDAKTYYSFALTLCLAVGIAFVLPVVLVMLNYAGVIQGRTIFKGWRVAVLVAALFSAFATPAADPLSMLLLMVPMILLFFMAVGLAMLNDRRRARRLARQEADEELALGAEPDALGA